MVKILIFIYHPENKDAEQKEGCKFEGFKNALFQVLLFIGINCGALKMKQTRQNNCPYHSIYLNFVMKFHVVTKNKLLTHEFNVLL
jgi:hypothetical protein